MRADPASGMMHTLESLITFAKLADDLLRQIALNIRIYNYDENQTINGKLTISQLADEIVTHIYGRSTSAVVFTVPSRAAAINALLGVSALMDMLRNHVKEKTSSSSIR